MPITLPLREVLPNDVAGAGGKGANLAALVRAGVPVPPGFVVLSEAYRCFVAANGLQAEIERQAIVMRGGDPESAAQASAAIRALFAAAPIPDDMASALLAAYAELGGSAVAVRSSATAEDLPAASFAGQHETMLNVHGDEALLRAVRLCWASLWTPHAVLYRRRQGHAGASVSMAVVVQRMVAATASGVLFTRHPVSGAADELVINATWGLGEALVSGQATPDVFVVRSATGELLRAEIADKRVETVAVADGTAEREVELADRTQRTLTAEQVARLARLGVQIEELFGRPQDIEWALEGDRIFVLQARAITTSPRSELVTVRQDALPVPGDDRWDRIEQAQPQQPYDLWTRANMGENFPEPITPLSATAWPLLMWSGAWPSKEERQASSGGQSSPARRFYGRLYVNEGGMIRLSSELGMPREFLDTVWGSGQGPRTPDDGKFHFGRMARRIPGMVREMTAQAGPRSAPKRKPAERVPSLRGARVFAQVDAWSEEFARQDLRAQDDAALWTRWVPLLAVRGKALTTAIVPAGMLAAIGFYLLERRLRVWTGAAGQTATLVRALSGVSSAEVGPALWELAGALRESGLEGVARVGSAAEALAALRSTPAAEPFLERFAVFLQRHGYRCPNDAELRNPRWADAPAQVMDLIRGYLDVDASRSPGAVEERARYEREALRRTIEAKLSLVRRLLFRQLLTRTQRGVRTRDNYRSAATKFLHPIRQLFAELGRRWAERGWLTDADDIFFLTAFEIEDIAVAGDPGALGRDLRRLVVDRRAAFEYWCGITAPAAIGPDGTPAPQAEPQGAALQGIGASGGRVRGRARLIRSIAEAARLEAGDIMVAAATDPGWTAVFPLASGLVIEVGGQLSHGAIVAREYGITAVINVPGAMQAIREGQLIEVDGSTGRISLLADEQTTGAPAPSLPSLATNRRDA